MIDEEQKEKKMYKLYDMNIRTMLDISPNEEDIIHTMNKEIAESILAKRNINMLILRKTEDTDYYYMAIHSFEDFINYVEDFKKREDMRKGNGKVLKK